MNRMNMTNRRVKANIRLARLMLFFVLPFGAAAHAPQDPVLDREVSVQISNRYFEDALGEIERAAGIRFFYSAQQLGITERITVEMKNKSLREVLEYLLAPYQITYTVQQGSANIILKRIHPKPGKDTASMHDQAEAALKRPVSGTVKDAATKQPMTGVSVFVKGTSVGTITGSDGAFTVEADNTDRLVFSFIGYETTEVAVGTHEVLDILLQEETRQLEEVVINAGYWHVRKDEQTGNIARVTAADIENQPVPNTLMALQGRMAGVSIVQTSGVSGSGVQVQIRGQNSLRNTASDNGNLPLYVIDGVPVEASRIPSGGALLLGGIDPLNLLNPANIESIEVLKDADATAIYGSRGANGVLLITTKNGRAGGMHIDVNGYAGVGKVSGRMKLLNVSQYLAMRREAFENDGVLPKAADVDMNGTWSETRNTDWQKELVGGTANLMDAQIAMTAGNEHTSYRVNLGTHQESTVFPGDFGYRKIMTGAALKHTSPGRKFSMTGTVSYGVDNNRLFSRNIIQDALTLPPNAPLFNEQGGLDWTGYTPSRMHPYSFFKISHAVKSAGLIANTRLRYEVIKGLHIGASLGYTDQQTSQLIKTPKEAMHPSQSTESTSTSNEMNSDTWIVEPQISYSREMYKGKLELLLGATWQEVNSHTVGIHASGYLTDKLLGNIRAARTVSILADEKIVYRYNAFFGRIGYNWKEKYMLNLTARRDGSSRFGADNQFGNFGAVGAAWIVSQENFLREHPWISFAKLRASYGTTGSDYVGNYGYLSTFTPSTNTYNGVIILGATSLANPDFGWEVNKKLETAGEVGFFKDRIRMVTSWYRNRSSNQLVGYPLPATSGFASVQYNLEAVVQNSGWEFEWYSVNVESPKVRWKSSLNITIPKNKLVAYPGIEASSYANTYVVGKPLTIRKLYHFKGVNPATGLYEVKDVNGSGSITTADRTYAANLGRVLFGGIQNTISWKQITLDFFIEIVKQKSMDYKSLFLSAPGYLYNQPALIRKENRWRAEGNEAELQRFTQTGQASYSPTAESNHNVTDASFVRMKSISLSWSLPAKMLRMKQGTEMRLYMQAQNLFTLTPYRGLNPESPTLQLPPLKVLTAGIHMKF